MNDEGIDPVELARARMLQAIEEYTQAVVLKAEKEGVRKSAVKAGKQSWKPGSKNIEKRRELARKNGALGGRPRAVISIEHHGPTGLKVVVPDPGKPTKKKPHVVWKD